MSAEPLCKPVTLAGQHVSLEPLSIVHCDDLRAATSDGEIWKLEYTIVPAPEGMMHEIRRRLALQHAGRMLPFAVRDLSRGCVVGMTTYMNLDASVQRVEIGSTWYARSAQRTAINTECKLLLLQHAFEVLDVIAVEFRTSYPAKFGIL